MRDLSRVIVFLSLFFIISVAQATNPYDNSVFAAEKIDINAAPLEDLVKIIHIGEARALELISLRPFSSLDELTKIKGIGELRIEDIKKQGLAWVSANESEKPAMEEPAVEVRLQQTYPSGIIINEILPAPSGPDETEEWIEVFNQNNFEVDLSNWQIVDIEGKTTTFTFPAGTKIAPKGFLVLSRPTTKITLNNDGDGLNLIQPNGNIIDSVTYEKAPRAQSYNRIDSDWVWSNVLTSGSANIIPALAPEIKEVKPGEEKMGQKEELKETKGIINEEKKLATVSQSVVEGNSESVLTFLIGLTLAVLSGIIILTLKKQIKKCIIK